MAYTKTTKSANKAAGSDGKPLLTGAQSAAKQTIDTSEAKFYELEIAEVCDVILNQEHPDYMKPDDIGMCKARQVNSEFTQPKEELFWYKPLHTNFREIPLIGEFVITVDYMGRKWYTDKVNLMGSINNNCMFHFSDGTKKDHGFIQDASATDYEESQAAGSTKDTDEEYKPGDLFVNNNFIQPLVAHEGHTMFNGRFGQSIRFGSRARLEEEEGYQDKAGIDPYVSPHILIRTGPLIDAETNGKNIDEFYKESGIPIEEDINDDGSSIWLTTQEDIPITIATADASLTPFTSVEQPEAYDGKQVIINSDRIIFNTKQNEFMCFSKADQYFNTEGKFAIDAVGDVLINNQANIDLKTETDFLVAAQGNVNIDGTSNINFGDSKGELLAKGETLQAILEELIDAIKNTISPAAAVAGPYPVSLTNPAFLDAVKAKLSTILSDRVTTI